MSLVFGACSVLDGEQLEPLPAQVSASHSGGGGVSGVMPAGRGGQNGGTGGVGGAGSAGGTGGTGGTGGEAGDDPDAGDATRCGDGMVTGTELCDTAIEAGEAGACPTECPALSECVKRALNGSGCRAECLVLQAQCEGGDGCCPGNCMLSNDNDCSASCGDGVVQPNEGETCESQANIDANSASDAGADDAGVATPCPVDCDDQNACTMDVLSGSVMNCNVDCEHVAITALSDGDGCCPQGGNAITDADCTPVCGNHTRERGEDCDSATGCNETCDLGFSTDQRHCLDTFAVTNDACALCECSRCTPTKLACFEDSNEQRGQWCVDLQACVRPSGCYDSACYCGDSWGCLAPNGPCVDEVEVAAETTNALDIDARKMDTNYAVGRSLALDNCIMSQCATACQ